MSPRSKMEYPETLYLRYKKTKREEKTLILNEFCINCGYHRKHAIRLLKKFKRFIKPKHKKRGKTRPLSSTLYHRTLKEDLARSQSSLFKTSTSHSALLAFSLSQRIR